jgi:prepilin-type N-terminal cleavage/methylation domain-containing protein/prepilin-type processing-associated H-X9-DG protein
MRGKTSASAFTLVELLTVMAVVAILMGLALPVLSRSNQKARRIACLSNLRQAVYASSMYANDDASGTLSNTRNDSDDDQNWLYPQYVSNLKIFNCPNTSNFVRSESAKTNPLTGVLILEDLSHYAHDPNSPGSSYEVYGFMNYTGTNFSEIMIDGVANQVPGVRKTLLTVQNYVHHFDAFGLKGTSPGPAGIWLLLDGDDSVGNNPAYGGNHGRTGLNVAFCDGHIEFVTPSKWAFSYEFSQDENFASQ